MAKEANTPNKKREYWELPSMNSMVGALKPLSAAEDYLSELPKANKITVLQFQKLLHPYTHVVIKPCNHKVYYSGDALYIPKDFYNCTVNDLGLRKRGQEEKEDHGSISLFIDKIDKFEAISDREELQDINRHFYFRSESVSHIADNEE